MSVADKLLVIAENVPKVYEAGQNSVVDESKIIEKSESGVGTLVLDDVSELPHEVGVTLSKINLLTYPYIQASQTVNGITFTDNGDGTITINGTATYQASFYFHGWSKTAVNIKEGETYTISGAVPNVCWIQGSNESSWPTDEGTGKTFVAGAGGYYFYILVKAGTTANNVVVKPQIERGTKATSYVPYVGELSTVSLSHIGKNLFDYSVLSNAGHTTINNPETGEFTFTDVNGIIGTPIVAKPNTAYRISGYVKGTIDGHNIYCSPNYTDGSNENISIKAIVGEYVYFEGLTNSNKTLASIRFGGSGGIKVGTVFKNLQVELSTDATPYEPFKKDYYPSSADGAVPRIKSLSPAMTFATDAGVKITANYHQSYGVYSAYNHFWDAFQRQGTKNEYRFAFFNWYERCYDPKYPIIMTATSNQAFYYFRGTDTKVDITLGTPTSQLFASSTLKTIRKLICTEGATAFTNAFQACSALETINFDGIVVASMDLSPCPLLTHASIMSLFNVLKNYAGSGSTYTVTLGATNLEKLTDTEKAIATGKGWTLA